MKFQDLLAFLYSTFKSLSDAQIATYGDQNIEKYCVDAKALEQGKIEEVLVLDIQAFLGQSQANPADDITRCLPLDSLDP